MVGIEATRRYFRKFSGFGFAAIVGIDLQRSLTDGLSVADGVDWRDPPVRAR